MPGLSNRLGRVQVAASVQMTIRARELRAQGVDIIALTIGCSLIGVVMFGTLAGSMLPFILRRCGLDPASASAPFVATLVDVTGLIIYFSVASVILRGVLL